jgi:hypothetical protein
MMNQSSILVQRGHGIVAEGHSLHRRQPGAGGFFIYLLRKPGRLFYSQNGRRWLTWLSAAVITLMDELTSGFYTPAEVYRFIGGNGLIVIALALT